MPRKTMKNSPKSQPKLNVSYSEELPVNYSNYANFAMTPFDLTIDFGFRHENKVEINSRVIVSPEHAKMMVLKLSAIVKEFEKGIGEIPMELKTKNE